MLVSFGGVNRFVVGSAGVVVGNMISMAGKFLLDMSE